MQMITLKITQKGFENYSGPIGVYMFENGVSIEPIPANERDRLSASIECVEVDQSGKEVTAGIAHRLVADAKMRAPVEKPMLRQSVSEKVEEQVSDAEKIMGNVKPIYSPEELDKIIEDGGIKELRGVAKEWNCKSKSIPALRQMILDAQEEYLKKHGDKIEKVKKAITEIVSQAEIKEDLQSEEVPSAAETGDMSAAITTDLQPE